MPEPSIAIVILNWNGRQWLEQFLPFVQASSYENKTIIVADNASKDESIPFLKIHYPQVRIIALSANYGFARGYNEALKQIKSDYYVLLNTDVEVEPGWIEPVIELMERDVSIGACQPKLLSYANRDLFEYAGAAGGWIDSLGYPFAKGRIFEVCEKDYGQYNKASPIFWASGAALFVRAALYHEIGGLDEYFFAHQEEIDFCWRLQLAGHRIFICPHSVVYHVGGGTLAKDDQRKIFLNFRNNLIMLVKNLPSHQLIWKVPFRIFLDMISAMKSLLDGRGIYFISVFKAHLAFLKWIIIKGGKRKFFKSKKGPLDGWYSGSVVWAYFIQHKQNFQEIVQNKP
jgi:GT2 family glycosyltransferase